jgi:hypothetical protein
MKIWLMMILVFPALASSQSMEYHDALRIKTLYVTEIRFDSAATDGHLIRGVRPRLSRELGGIGVWNMLNHRTRIDTTISGTVDTSSLNNRLVLLGIALSRRLDAQDTVSLSARINAIPKVVSGRTAFTTTAARKAVYLPGVTATSNFTCTPLSPNGTTAPVLANVCFIFLKTDSLIFIRGASGLTGMTVMYVGTK